MRQRSLKVNVGALTGSIMLIRSNLSSVTPSSTRPRVYHSVIQNNARIQVSGTPKQIGEPRLVYIDNGVNLQLAFEIVAGAPGERWRMTFDAQTAKLLEKKSLLLDRCFESNGGEEASHQHAQIDPKQPLATPLAAGSGRLTALVHPGTPNDQLVEVGLPDMDLIVNGVPTRTDSLGFWTLPTVTYPLIINTAFQNPFLSVIKSGAEITTLLDTISSGPGNIKWDNSNSTSSERDAMYSLLRARRHVKSIEPALSEIDVLLRTTVDYAAACNAYYDFDEKSFTFFATSSTCNASAQVADVVFHEYGHRVNHCRYLETDVHNMQDYSLNEGFADIFSMLMRDDPRIGIGFYTNPTRVLRNCENNRKWPTHIDPDPHINGLIVAGAYWDLRKAVGLPTSITLFHSMSQLTPDGNGAIDAQSLLEAFTQVLVTTILADDNDNNLSNGTPHLDDILASFEKHNITLGAMLDLGPIPIADQPAEATSYPVRVIASYDAPVGALDDASVTLHYSTDAKSYSSLLLERSSDSTFDGMIPKVPAGSIISYYASARTTLDDARTSPIKEAAMKFFVGFERKFYDDFETNMNWLKTDSVVSGNWERGDPFGTSYASAVDVLIQQDTDHTAIGTACYITGNTNTSNPSFDDVDNGYTRLTSPPLQLSGMRDPYIRYWYYFSNDMGSNPGISRFHIELSDNSTTWKEVFTTTTATDGWQQGFIRIKDHVSLTNTVHIRYVATDSIGSLVEAGVDDVEVLEPKETQSVLAEGSFGTSELSIYPHPVTGNELRIQFNFDDADEVVLSLRDLLGAERLRMKATTDNQGYFLQLPPTLQNGMYMLTATTERASHSAKVIISR